MKYRSEIDGLRTVAVLPVVFYHFGIPPFTGGFVGVDVFFVISGFLITQLLVQDETLGRFSIVRFYERRVRRIVPALVVVMAACVPVAMYTMLPVDLVRFGSSIVATVAFSSNFFFWRFTDYFTGSGGSAPLLHTWSLAVEEQFYIFYPLLLVFLYGRGKRNLPVTLGILGLGSLAASLWAIDHMPVAAFYLSPFRAWELLLGAVIATTAWVPKNRLTNEVLSVLGLGLIGWACLAYSDLDVFPGWRALPPCLGAGLIIFSNRDRKTLVGQLLSLPVAVFIGKISYSLYLWHWPLVVFYRLIWSAMPDLETGIVLTALAIGLATLSWRYVERPFREGASRAVPLLSRRSVFAAAGLAGGLLLAFGSVTIAAAGFPDRLRPDVRRIAGYMDYSSTREFVQTNELGTCQVSERSSLPWPAPGCLALRRGARNILIWGDSHAAQYFYGLDIASAGSAYHLLHAAFSGCLPQSGPSERERSCTDFNSAIIKFARDKADGVIISGRWLDYPDAPARLEATVDTLQKSAVPVVVLGPSIEYGDKLPIILARHAQFEPGTPLNASPYLYAGLFALDSRLKTELRGKKGVTYISVLDSICPKKACPTTLPDGSPLQWDASHLTAAGSRVVGAKLWPDLMNAFSSMAARRQTAKADG